MPQKYSPIHSSSIQDQIDCTKGIDGYIVVVCNSKDPERIISSYFYKRVFNLLQIGSKGLTVNEPVGAGRTQRFQTLD